MCEATAIAAGVLAVGGMIASQQGAQAASDARNQVINNAQSIQNGLAAQSGQDFNTELTKFSQPNQAATQTSAVNARQSAITSAMAPTTANPAASGMNPNAPRIVGQTANMMRGNNANLAAGEGSGLARLGSFGDLMTNDAVSLTRAGQNINNIAGFSQGQEGLVPAELTNANNSGSDLRTLGGLLSTTGSAVGAAGGAGGGGSYDFSGGNAYDSSNPFNLGLASNYSGSPFGYGYVGKGGMTYGQLISGQ